MSIGLEMRNEMEEEPVMDHEAHGEEGAAYEDEGGDDHGFDLFTNFNAGNFDDRNALIHMLKKELGGETQEQENDASPVDSDLAAKIARKREQLEQKEMTKDILKDFTKVIDVDLLASLFDDVPLPPDAADSADAGHNYDASSWTMNKKGSGKSTNKSFGAGSYASGTTMKPGDYAREEEGTTSTSENRAEKLDQEALEHVEQQVKPSQAATTQLREMGALIAAKGLVMQDKGKAQKGKSLIRKGNFLEYKMSTQQSAKGKGKVSKQGGKKGPKQGKSLDDEEFDLTADQKGSVVQYITKFAGGKKGAAEIIGKNMNDSSDSRQNAKGGSSTKKGGSSKERTGPPVPPIKPPPRPGEGVSDRPDPWSGKRLSMSARLAEKLLGRKILPTPAGNMMPLPTQSSGEFEFHNTTGPSTPARSARNKISTSASEEWNYTSDDNGCLPLGAAIGPPSSVPSPGGRQYTDKRQYSVNRENNYSKGKGNKQGSLEKGALIRPPSGELIRPPSGELIRPPSGELIRPPPPLSSKAASSSKGGKFKGSSESQTIRARDLLIASDVDNANKGSCTGSGKDHAANKGTGKDHTGKTTGSAAKTSKEPVNALAKGISMSGENKKYAASFVDAFKSVFAGDTTNNSPSKTNANHDSEENNFPRNESQVSSNFSHVQSRIGLDFEDMSPNRHSPGGRRNSDDGDGGGRAQNWWEEKEQKARSEYQWEQAKENVFSKAAMPKITSAPVSSNNQYQAEEEGHHYAEDDNNWGWDTEEHEEGDQQQVDEHQNYNYHGGTSSSGVGSSNNILGPPRQSNKRPVSSGGSVKSPPLAKIKPEEYDQFAKAHAPKEEDLEALQGMFKQFRE